MLIRGQTTEERIAQIAQGFKQGVDGYAAGQQRENKALMQEAETRQRALEKAAELEVVLSEKTGKNLYGSGAGKMLLNGDNVGLGEILKNAGYTPEYEYKQSKEKWEDEKRKADLKKAQKELEEMERPYEQTRDYQKATAVAKIQGEARSNADYNRQQNQINKKMQEVQISDFDVANPNILPSNKDAEEVKKLNASNKNFQQIGSSAYESVKNAKPRDLRYFISNDWKLLNQNLTKMKLQAKNLEDLGVLNGPDLGLVNETLGSIDASSLAILGPEKAAERLKSAMDTMNNVVNNTASARGYAPRGSQAAPTAPAPSAINHPQAPEAIKWAKENPNTPEAAEIFKLFGGA